VIYAYTVSQGLVHVLKACGDDLTRENVMKQAASIKGLELGGLLPGIKVTTSATTSPDLPASIDEIQGRKMDLFGDIISGDVALTRRCVNRLLKKQPLAHGAGAFC